MAPIHPVTLGSVRKTLLLPLWGRAVEARKPRPLLIDSAAVRIIDSIAYDFSTIAAHINFVTRLSWIARSLHIDRTIRQFLARYPSATIVNLGCGLDTTFERVDNERLRWYDLDLPDVVELRSQYIQQRPRRHFIAASILDDAWMNGLASVDPMLFVAAGLLYYFTESDVKSVLGRLADQFPGSELIFDACSVRGVRIANRRVIRDGGMDADAQLKWGLGKAAEIESWDRRFTVLAEYPIFRGLKGTLSLKEKCGTLISDTLRIMSMVHLGMDLKRGNRA